jgi:hypothetical protein
VRIEDLSIDELIQLNEIICERIDHLRELENHDMLVQLHLGSQVHFMDKMGRRIFGRVIKINRKTIIVQTDAGKQWKIPPSLASLVKDV